jgi:hypothetical protein
MSERSEGRRARFCALLVAKCFCYTVSVGSSDAAPAINFTICARVTTNDDRKRYHAATYRAPRTMVVNPALGILGMGTV